MEKLVLVEFITIIVIVSVFAFVFYLSKNVRDAAIVAGVVATASEVTAVVVAKGTTAESSNTFHTVLLTALTALITTLIVEIVAMFTNTPVINFVIAFAITNPIIILLSRESSLVASAEELAKKVIISLVMEVGLINIGFYLATIFI